MEEDAVSPRIRTRRERFQRACIYFEAQKRASLYVPHDGIKLGSCKSSGQGCNSNIDANFARVEHDEESQLGSFRRQACCYEALRKRNNTREGGDNPTDS